MSRFTDLIRAPFSERIYLVEITGYDLTANSVRSVYFSDVGYITKPTDVPANAWYDERVNSPLVFTRTMFQGQRIGGRSFPGNGRLVLNNTDGGLDYLQDWSFAGRRIVVKLGGKGFAFTEFGVILDGTIAGTPEFTEDEVIFLVRDNQEAFEKPLSSAIYAGTGGLEGPADLAGKHKPVCFGRVRVVDPVYLGVIGGFHTYQVHDGPVGAIDYVRDSGVPLTQVGGDPASGQFSPNLTNGTFRLATLPFGTLGVDVRGDATGSYVQTAADLLVRIAARAGTWVTDTAAVAALNAKTSAVCGIYDQSGQVPIGGAMDVIANSVGGHWGFDRQGRLTMGRLDAPSGTPVVWFGTDEEADDVLTLTQLASTAPLWRVEVGWRRVWNVYSSQELAGSVDQGNREYLTQEWRVAWWQNTTVKVLHLLAKEQRFDTALDEGEAAGAESTRLGELLSVPRRVFEVKGKTQPFALDLGSVVGLRDPRHRLQDGKLFVVIGLSEDALTNEVVVTLWG